MPVITTLALTTELSGMALVSAGATVYGLIGSAYSAYSQYQAGKSQEGMADYNAQIARNNAIASQQKAEADADSAKYEQKKHKARVRASYAKAGIQMAGTSLLVMAEQAGDMALDLANIRRQGEFEARSYNQKANIWNMKGDMAYQQGVAGAVSTGLKTINQIKKWEK